MNRQGRKNGFTLIEMLVVIAIIGILISMLMPSLSSARRQVRRLVCRNNLRSIWTGIRMYAMTNNERVPYIEAYEDDNEEPFDPENRTAVGTVLFSYVEPGSWVCPSAIAGYPQDAGKGGWKLTYDFLAVEEPWPEEGFDQDTEDFESPFVGGPKYLSNYVQFDGRPERVLDGRRYTTSGATQVHNFERRYDRWWSVRQPLIWDRFPRKTGLFPFSPRYPHRGDLDRRPDLGKAEKQFYRNTNFSTAKTGIMAMYADGSDVQTYFTRWWEPHPPGY